MNKYEHLFTQSNCLSKGQLLNYIQQKMDKDEVYLVESHLNDCPLCSDAIDGIMEENIETSHLAIAEIKTAIDEKIKETHKIVSPTLRHNQANKIATNLKPKLNTQSNNKYKWMAAASILLFIGLGGYSVYSYIKSQEQTALAQNQPSKATKEVDYNKSEDIHANEISTLRINPADSLALPTSSDQVENTKSLKESPSVSTVKQVPKIDDTKDKIAETKPVSSNTKMPEATTNSKVDIEYAAKSENIEPNQGMSNFDEEKKYIAPQKDVLAKKKSSDIGLSNTKANYAPPGTKQLSYPAQQNNNVNDDAQVLETVARSSNGKESNIVKSDFDMAMDYYNTQAYKKSIEYFEKALKNATGTQKEDIQFQLAQAYLKIGKHNKAEKLFEILAQGTKYKNESIESMQKVKK